MDRAVLQVLALLASRQMAPAVLEVLALMASLQQCQTCSDKCPSNRHEKLGQLIDEITMRLALWELLCEHHTLIQSTHTMPCSPVGPRSPCVGSGRTHPSIRMGPQVAACLADPSCGVLPLFLRSRSGIQTESVVLVGGALACHILLLLLYRHVSKVVVLCLSAGHDIHP